MGYIIEFNMTKIVIKNLQGIESKELGFIFSPEEALEFLKESSKQDFGYDADMWTKFFDGKLEPSYYEPAIRHNNNLVIDNLQGIYHKEEPYNYPPEAALEYLRKTTKQDFGYDAEMWRKYLEENLDLSNYLPKNMKE
jgi:hypothetical protein